MKSELATSTGIPATQHRVLHRGRELTDDTVRLSSLNLPDNAVLHMATRPPPEAQQQGRAGGAPGAAAGAGRGTGGAPGPPQFNFGAPFAAPGIQGGLGNLFSMFQGMPGAQGPTIGGAAPGGNPGGGPGARAPTAAVLGSFTLGPGGIVSGPSPDAMNQIQQSIAQMFGNLGNPGGIGPGGAAIAVPIGFPAVGMTGATSMSGDATLPSDTPVLQNGRYAERSVIQGLDEMLVRLQNGNMETDPGPGLYVSTSEAVRRPEVRNAWSQSALTMLRSCRAVLRNANLNRETLAAVNRIFTAAGLESLPLGVRSFPIGDVESEEEGAAVGQRAGGGTMGSTAFDGTTGSEEDEDYYSDEYDHDEYYEDDSEEYDETDSEEYEESDEEEEIEIEEAVAVEEEESEGEWETDTGEGSELPPLVSDIDEEESITDGTTTVPASGTTTTFHTSGRAPRAQGTTTGAAAPRQPSTAGSGRTVAPTGPAQAPVAQAPLPQNDDDNPPPLLESCSEDEEERQVPGGGHVHGNATDDSLPSLSTDVSESESERERLLSQDEESYDDDTLPTLMSDPEDDFDEPTAVRSGTGGVPQYTQGGTGTGTAGRGYGGTGTGTAVSDAWFSSMVDDDLILVAAVTVGELARRFMGTLGQETAPVGVNAMIMRLATRLRSLSSLDSGRREITVSCFKV